jgi:ABC-type antimicrobial peptide transport system permease subunit
VIPVIALSMMIFTATASILSGLYSAPAAFAADGGFVIASPTAPTIFASNVDVNMVETLSALPQIIGASPEVFAFSSYEGESFVVRGVMLDMLNATGPAFKKFVLSGGSPEDNDSAMIGSHLKSRLGITLPVTIPVVGSYSTKLDLVNIVGYFETGTSLDDEMLVSLDTARFLSGMNSQKVSIIRVSTTDPDWLSGLLSPEGARFTLFDMLTQKSQAALGETIGVSVGVRNWGMDAGEVSVKFAEGGTELANMTVSLNSSGSDRVVAMLSFRSLGLHTITASIGGSFPVTLSVNVTVVQPYLTIAASSKVALGETLAVTVLTYTSSVAEHAQVTFGTRTNTTDANGQTSFVADVAGTFSLSASLVGFTNASANVQVVDPASYPAEFQPSVVSFTLSPDTIKQSETATGVVVVENNGSVSGIFNVTVYVDSVPQTVLNISLEGLGSATTTFHLHNLGTGSHIVQVASFSEALDVQSWVVDNPDLVQLVMRYGGSGSVFSAGSVPIYQAAKISEGNVAIALFSIGSISALLAILAITSVFSKEIREARRRLGILKTIGAPRSAIRKLVFPQALEDSLAGAAIGISLGVVIADAISRSDLLVLFGHRFRVDLDANLLLLLLLGAVAISVSSALISMMVAVRETTIRSIRKLDAEPEKPVDVEAAIADE